MAGGAALLAAPVSVRFSRPVGPVTVAMCIKYLDFNFVFLKRFVVPTSVRSPVADLSGHCEIGTRGINN